MNMETKDIDIRLVEMNTGQIDGLPSNPRQWTKDDVKRIAKSLRETPELFAMRPCIVYPQGGKYILLGGNLRYCGAKENKDKTVPCIVVDAATSVDKLKEIVIKDNGSFGAWDYDALGNEWDDLPLNDWGVPAWDAEQVEEENESKDVQEDDFDENVDEIAVRCKPGDIWELGEHRLKCGDSIDLQEVKTLLGGGKNGPSDYRSTL